MTSGAARGRPRIAGVAWDVWVALRGRPVATSFQVAAIVFGLVGAFGTGTLASAGREEVLSSVDSLSNHLASIRWESWSAADESRRVVADLKASEPIAAAAAIIDAGTRQTALLTSAGTVSSAPLQTFAADPNALRVIAPDIDSATVSRFALPGKAMLGRGAIDSLGFDERCCPDGFAVLAGGRRYDVVGVLPKLRDRQDLREAVLVSDTDFGSDATAVEFLVAFVDRSSDDALDDVSGVIGAARRDEITVVAAPIPTSIRAAVSASSAAAMGAVGWVALGLSVMVMMTNAANRVANRASEIGLRRAFGASRLDIAAVTVGESVALGMIAGLVAAVVIAVALPIALAALGWSVATGAASLPVIVGTGAGTGLVAGLLPAIRASSISPAQALRA